MRGLSMTEAAPVQTEKRAPDVFDTLLSTRSVFLNGPIDDNVAAVLCAQILLLDSQAPDREIVMYVNSPGGMVTSGLAIYDTMQYVKCPVATVCLGTARSMASLLLAAGTRGRRAALPNASILLHQPSGGFQGSAADVERHAADIVKVKHRIAQLYVKHTGRPYEQVERTLDRDSFLTAEEALAWGLVDHVRESRD